MKNTGIRNLRVTDDSLDRYLEGDYPAFIVLYTSFLRTVLNEGEVSRAQVALEILSKLYLHKTKRISVVDTIGLLPDEWQGDIVPVPLPVLEALMPSYSEFARAPENSTLGQAWGLEGKGTTGRRRSARNLQALKKDLSLALEIEELYHLDKFRDVGSNVENLIQEVAVRRGVSDSRARKAYERFKVAARTYLDDRGLFAQD